MTRAARFAAKLFAFQLAAHLATSGVVAALAPTLLLLEASLRHELAPVGLVLFVLSTTSIAVATLAVTWPVGSIFRALEAQSSDEPVEIEPETVRLLELVPTRLTLSYVVTVVVLVTLFTLTRSARADLSTHVALAALALTLVSGVSLASFTILRSQVGEVMAEIPPKINEEAFVQVREARRPSRVAARVALSVAAPAALVAVGAVLLVYAHLRAAVVEAKVKSALSFTRATLEPIEGERLVYDDVIAAAREHGYFVQVSDVPQPEVRVQEDERGETTVRAPLGDRRSVIVSFDSGNPSAHLGLVFGVAALGIAFAAVAGRRLGSALSHDLEVARLQVELMGARDVLRGFRVRKKATFRPVRALTDSIEKLGGIFREFAFAQERAIVAKERVEQTRGLFLASMSHDLKAPLNAVLGFAELVGRQPLTEGQRESLAIIEQRGRELLHLVRTILDASRAEAGALELTVETFRVADVVTTAVLDARELEERRIEAEVASDLPDVTGDPARIAQAIELVILSGCRLGGNGVSVRASASAAGVRVDVEALGSSLSAEERQSLFSAFERAESARNLGSLGLGLVLARAIARAHGGELEIESAGASGTLFRFSLPR